MQSNPPPNLANLANLNQVFKKYDTDGKVNDSQINEIFKEIGYTDVYIGTIKKIIRLLNVDTPENQTLDFLQLQEFAQAMVTPGKFQVWKAKYQMLQSLKQMTKEIYGQEQSNNNNTAAPGAGPGSQSSGAPSKYGPQSTSQQGEISFKIGQNPTDQHINFKLQKQNGNQIKPFVKISIQRHTNQQANNLQTIFKSIYDTVIQIIKAQQQDIVSQILSVSFITSVNNNIFNLFITTNNQGLIDVVELAANYLDLLVKQHVNAKLEANYKFQFDFNKFVNDKNYSFYDMFVRNCSLSVKWSVWNLFRNLRKIALKAGLLEDLQWDTSDAFSLFLITLLHTQKFVGKLQFDNTPSNNQQGKSKQQIASLFKNIKGQLQDFQNDTSVNILGFLQQLDNKISIQIGVRDWKLYIDAKLTNFTKIFTQDIKNNSQQNQNYNNNYSYNANQQNHSSNTNPNENESDEQNNSQKGSIKAKKLTKKSSLGLIKKHSGSSDQSIEKIQIKTEQLKEKKEQQQKKQ